MKNKKHIILIIIYGLILVFSLLGLNHLYGSNVDWLSQHSIIPEYFRSIFYETGKLIPNFVFNLGAGQNIFNYSYYGLMSPVILISYLLPFVSMTMFIQVASIILYILFGLLMYKFINDNFHNEKIALVCSLMALTISSVNYNFHHHIMFVFYLPFLVLALMGVDRYINSRKSDLFILSCFLIVLTNYYYSVSSFFAILFYGIYKILKKNDFNIKISVKESFFFGICFIVPILMSLFILLPSFYSIKNVSRESSSINFLSLLFPKAKELFYNPTGFGIVGIIFVSLVSNLFVKKKDKSDLAFNIILILFMTIPIFMFVFNGMLYPRGKVLIPFIPLYLYSFGMFLSNFKSKKYDFIKIGIFLLIFVILMFIFNTDVIKYPIILDIVVGFIFVVLSIKFRKQLFIIYTFVCLLIVLVSSNKAEKYVEVSHYKEINNPGISRLYEDIKDKDIYRSYNIIEPKDDVNKVYSSNYYSTGIYSSTYNSLYHEAFNEYFGNNIKYRNEFITTGSDNDLFHTFMGVRYITSYDRDSLYYEKIGEDNGVNLYYNPSAYPIMYVSNNLGNYKKLDSLHFPYNLEYMMNYSVVSNGDNEYKSIINKVDVLEDKFKFKYSKKTVKNYSLDSKYNGKILYIKFKLNNNMHCGKGGGDAYITINGITNKLTCLEHTYHNKNNVFEYVIPIVDSSLGLDVEVSKGEYNISDLEVYYSDKIGNNYSGINDLKFNKKDSIITGSAEVEQDSYIISSIPYDKGFSVFVNDKKVEVEKVNHAFLGFKVKSGNNKIVIKYNSPLYKPSKYISIIGLLIFIGVIILENKTLKSTDKK